MAGMISIDCETSGVDFYHGAMPYFVTTRKDGEDHPKFWEWDVDPLTRKVAIPRDDIAAIVRLYTPTSGRKVPNPDIVLQNGKFDAAALRAAGIQWWPWYRMQDTLCAGHILASNEPHNLTDMAMHYLGVDILPFEEELKIAVNEARRLTRTRAFTEEYGEWRIAKEGQLEMPSAKSGSKKDKKGVESESPWKFDSWLPRTIARHCGYPKSHPWWTVLSDYGNADSAVTGPLWKAQKAELERRGLMGYYQEKLKVLPIISEMEYRGLNLLTDELQDLKTEYVAESINAEETCCEIANELGCDDLTLPKSGNNKSLTTFIFDVLKLPVVKYTEKNNPSLDKECIEEYKKTLPKDSLQYKFIKALSGKRKRDKSLEYLEAYEKYAINEVLHPSVNPTGTTTTRFSCSNPNLQQVSKQESICEECLGDGCEECDQTGEDLHSVRRVFGPAEGREWWTCDAKNIELRIPAYESGEEDLIALFERPNDPPFYGSQHLLNMSIVFDDIWEQELAEVGFEKVGPHCKKKYQSTFYQNTKNGDFAIQYQCGEDMADKTFKRKGAFRKLKSKFVKLEGLNQRQVRHAEVHGYVETIPDRTIDPKRGYPLLCSRGEWGKIIPTTPLNYRTQGTAGWWMHKAMIRCYEKLKEWRQDGYDGFIALTVHDELIFDLPKRADPSKNPRASNLGRVRVLQKLMERGGDDIGIPTPVGVEYHPVSWAEGVTF